MFACIKRRKKYNLECSIQIKAKHVSYVVKFIYDPTSMHIIHSFIAWKNDTEYEALFFIYISPYFFFLISLSPSICLQHFDRIKYFTHIIHFSGWSIIETLFPNGSSKFSEYKQQQQRNVPSEAIV